MGWELASVLSLSGPVKIVCAPEDEEETQGRSKYSAMEGVAGPHQVCKEAIHVRPPGPSIDHPPNAE